MIDRTGVINALHLLPETRQANWDGYDALAVDPHAIEVAIRIIQSLPDDIPDPEVDSDADGSVSLDWDRGNRQILSVSVSGVGHNSWAMMIVNNGAFPGLIVPLFLLDVIRSLEHMPMKLNG